VSTAWGLASAVGLGVKAAPLPLRPEWTDAEPTRHSCTALGTLGEHLADSLGKGYRILVVGTLSDTWADRDTGEQRTMQRVLVDAASASNATGIRCTVDLII